ncbi:hypothetical protein COBT_003767, partial [Conglomerata obtusa]
MQSHPDNIPTPQYNMATAAKNIRPFNGIAGEDVRRWARELESIASVSNLSEMETKQLILTSLRENALRWAAETIHPTL